MPRDRVGSSRSSRVIVAGLLVVAGACTVEAEGEDPAEMEDVDEFPGDTPGDDVGSPPVPDDAITDDDAPADDDEPSGVSPPELDLVVDTVEDVETEHLADGDGYAIYASELDGDLESHCTGECLATWPIVSVASLEAVDTGDGVDDDLISVIEREDGSLQLTYDGYPLHRYVDDEAGAATGHGLDSWSLIAPDGQLLETG